MNTTPTSPTISIFDYPDEWPQDWPAEALLAINYLENRIDELHDEVEAEIDRSECDHLKALIASRSISEWVKTGVMDDDGRNIAKRYDALKNLLMSA